MLPKKKKKNKRNRNQSNKSGALESIWKKYIDWYRSVDQKRDISMKLLDVGLLTEKSSNAHKEIKEGFKLGWRGFSGAKCICIRNKINRRNFWKREAEKGKEKGAYLVKLCCEMWNSIHFCSWADLWRKIFFQTQIKNSKPSFKVLFTCR